MYGREKQISLLFEFSPMTLNYNANKLYDCLCYKCDIYMHMVSLLMEQIIILVTVLSRLHMDFDGIDTV